MNTYFGKISAWIACGHCDEKHMIVSPAEIDSTDEHMDSFGDQAKDVIEDQLDAEGWGYDGKYCPDCMTTHGKQIADIERADDDIGFDYGDMIENLAERRAE